jgi:molybdopterin-guanine dinucleotide biosynthesis protein A
MEMSAIVLAGGEGVRFGGNKALVRIGGKRLIEVIVERVGDLFDEVMIVGDLVPETILSHLRHLPDMVRCGPIGGIYTGLLKSKTEYSFVLGCDMPLVNREFIRFMMEGVEGYDLVIPMSKRGPEPLHSIYSKGCLPYIERQISRRDFRITELFKCIRNIKYIEGVDWAEGSFFNMNTPEDLRWLIEEKGVW